MKKYLVDDTTLVELANAEDLYRVFCLYYELEPTTVVPREDLQDFYIGLKHQNETF